MPRPRGKNYFIAWAGSGVTAIPFGAFSTQIWIEYRADRTAAPGLRIVSCKYSDQAQPVTMESGVTVYDATPVITHVQQDEPVVQGGPFYATLYGVNFGPVRGMLTTCVANAPNCNGTSDLLVTLDDVGAFWRDDQIRALFTPSPSAFGTYEVELSSLGLNGSFFQPAPQAPPAASQPKTRGAVNLSTPRVTLVEFGWGNSQELWKTTTFGSNGDSQGDSLSGIEIKNSQNQVVGWTVWKDPAFNGGVALDEPLALRAGQDTAYLAKIVLRTTPAYTGTAELQVIVSPGDFSFMTLPFSFTNGTATINNLNLLAGSSLPNVIKSSMYQFKWRVRFLPAGSAAEITTSHRVYLKHQITSVVAGSDRITTKRLAYSVEVADNVRSIDEVVARVGNRLSYVYPLFGNGFFTTAEKLNQCSRWTVEDRWIASPSPGSPWSSCSNSATLVLGCSGHFLPVHFRSVTQT